MSEVGGRPFRIGNHQLRTSRVALLCFLLLLLASTTWFGYRIYRQLRQERLDQSMIQAIVSGKELRALSIIEEGADVNAVQRSIRHIQSLADVIDLLRGRQRAATGPSALALAVQLGRERMALRLLERGARDVHARPKGSALLVWAVRNKQPKVALDLLAKGANGVNEPGTLYDRPRSLLDCSLELSAEPLAHALLDSGAHELKDETGEFDPLALASGRGMLDVVKKLVARGHPIDGTEWGLFPLSNAAENGHLEIMRFLIQHGAKVETNHSWDTPLMSAASGGHLEAVKFLLEHGALINHGERFGTALTHAGNEKRWHVVKYLIDHGAAVDAGTYHGYNALTSAIRAHNEQIVRFLLDHGADPQKYLHFGWTSFLDACGKGSLGTIRLMVDRGATINAVDGAEHSTPLIEAAKAGHLDAVKYLLVKGADPNVKLSADTYDGVPYSSALMFAKKNKHSAVVKELLRAGAKR